MAKCLGHIRTILGTPSGPILTTCTRAILLKFKDFVQWKRKISVVIFCNLGGNLCFKLFHISNLVALARAIYQLKTGRSCRPQSYYQLNGVQEQIK